MTLDLVRRSTKGSPLTAADHDGNLDKLEQAIEGIEPTPGTDLSYTPSTRLLGSSTGQDATLPLAGTDAGLLAGVSFTGPSGWTASGSVANGTITLSLALPAGGSLVASGDRTAWDTAYAERLRWDGGSTGLNASTARTSLGLGTAATTDASAYATAAQGAKADTAIQPGNAALTDAREWSAETISQAEAEAGSATTRRAFTAQRVFQAAAAAAPVQSVAGRTGNVTLSVGDVSGAVGTNDARLTDPREWSAATIDQEEAEAGTGTTRRAFTAQRVFQAVAAWWAASSAKTKLDGIAAGAQVNVPTDLSYTASSRQLESSTGTDATLPLFATNSSNAGLVPGSSTGGTTNFLRADGTWAAPPGGSPGGSNTQIQYNNNGAFGGLSTLTADGSGNLTLTGRLTNSTNGAANAPAKTLSGTWFTGGTATTTKPQFLLEPAGTTSTNWNPGGTGLGINAPSGFLGNLLDLQLNGSTRARITASGAIEATGQSYNFAAFKFVGHNSGLTLWAQGHVGIIRQDVLGLVFTGTDHIIGSSQSFAWSSGTAGISATDIYLYRDAAGTLAQRNGTNAQTFRVYNTFTSATNNELGKLEWSGNVFRVGTEKGSGGGTARAMALQTDGTNRLVVDTIGSLQVATALKVETLPPSPLVGMIARVTDASAPTAGSTVTAGGSANALCWYNGSNWTVLGV